MQTFRSKIDWWFWGAVIATTGLLLKFLWTMYVKGTMQEYPEHAVLYFLTIAILWWPIFNTRYIVTEQHLIIRSLWFKWQINKSDVKRISSTHYFISSPALSLDRLRIDYLKNGETTHILVSPKDKQAFCKALNQSMMDH
ncbi:PH domain-containing protein [Acinetobacter sp. ANC 3882]|uniref:PH domain-containing protein n=1 Tax=Acinetobacter sp. ANC 3882 TaxID=2923423 RepID=UPI001F4AF28E|nr:PH domain-containing protein [Acinetobacter sp. ANC 3882]MCH7314933.1 PH domain-containing protein [Acinetobacter sp. ANC 3882]